MAVFPDRLCLVQPSSGYQIASHQYAQALTFPYLIKLLELDRKFRLSLYVEGRTKKSFYEHLQDEQPRWVLITSNTATFSHAVSLARTAKGEGCKVILGGIFASMNADTIAAHYDCFDKIIKGAPPVGMFDSLLSDRIVEGRRMYDIDFEVADILNSPLFDCYQNDPVCYEITFGCTYNCSFCSLRHIWGTGVCSHRSAGVVCSDLRRLAGRHTLKIIDDDILQSPHILTECDFRSSFKKVIAETRIDRINKQSMSILKEFGVTHLIMGVESFENELLVSSLKSHSGVWTETVFRAMDLCAEYHITARPVLQVLYPGMSKNYLRNILPYIKDWTPKNQIEIFFSFFTPHPGLGFGKGLVSNLLTNDLSDFDHLHPVYMPDGYDVDDV
ncbi:B12-binding domain-containing radical SAM protein, partial [Phocaeicola sp.]